MRQNLDGSTTPHMLKRSTCGFVIAKPRCARQVQNLPHTSEKHFVSYRWGRQIAMKVRPLCCLGQQMSVAHGQSKGPIRSFGSGPCGGALLCESRTICLACGLDAERRSYAKNGVALLVVRIGLVVIAVTGRFAIAIGANCHKTGIEGGEASGFVYPHRA